MTYTRANCGVDHLHFLRDDIICDTVSSLSQVCLMQTVKYTQVIKHDSKVLSSFENLLNYKLQTRALVYIFIKMKLGYLIISHFTLQTF